MRFKVTQALRLGSVSYPRGVHNFSEAEAKNPHFAKYLKCGYLISLEEKLVPTLVEVAHKEPALEEPKEGKSKKKKKE